jgi:hypothetical protein
MINEPLKWKDDCFMQQSEKKKERMDRRGGGADNTKLQRRKDCSNIEPRTSERKKIYPTLSYQAPQGL